MHPDRRQRVLAGSFVSASSSGSTQQRDLRLTLVGDDGAPLCAKSARESAVVHGAPALGHSRGYAEEGQKFGVGLVIVSRDRPAARMILSQCNNFVVSCRLPNRSREFRRRSSASCRDGRGREGACCRCSRLPVEAVVVGRRAAGSAGRNSVRRTELKPLSAERSRTRPCGPRSRESVARSTRRRGPARSAARRQADLSAGRADCRPSATQRACVIGPSSSTTAVHTEVTSSERVPRTSSCHAGGH